MLFLSFLSLVCLTAIHDTDRGCGPVLSSVDANRAVSYNFWNARPFSAPRSPAKKRREQDYLRPIA
jgi:hypothetical protein